MEDDRQRYRVAVIVFADALGVDYSDAASGAELAVRHRLSPNRGVLPVSLPVFVPPRTGQSDVARVVLVMELGRSAANGYLWTEPTRRAWKDYGHDYDSRAKLPPLL